MKTQQKKVLVTGATGLIGQALVKQLIATGYQVIFLSSNKSKLDHFGDKVKGYFWDIERGFLEKEALVGVDVVVHLAGENISGSWSKEGKQKILSSRIASSKLLYTALSECDHHVKQIVCASALGIYANLDERQEESNYTLANNFLGKVVQQWEGENNKFSTLGIKVSHVRIGLVLAKEGGALPIMAKAVKLYVGSPFGSGQQYYSWIHLQDLIGVFSHLIRLELVGVFNGVAPNPVTNKVFTQILGKVLKRPIIRIGVPQFILKMVLGEKSCLLLEGQHVSSKKIEGESFCFEFSTLESALLAIFAKK